MLPRLLPMILSVIASRQRRRGNPHTGPPDFIGMTRTEYFGGDAASVILRIFFCRRQKVRRINAAAA